DLQLLRRDCAGREPSYQRAYRHEAQKAFHRYSCKRSAVFCHSKSRERRRLEAGTDLELEALKAVAGLAVQWKRVAQLQRSDRRDPGKAETRRCAQIREAHRLLSVPHLARVDEGQYTQRAVGTRQRREHFHRAVEAPRAARGIAETVARSE